MGAAQTEMSAPKSEGVYYCGVGGGLINPPLS